MANFEADSSVASLVFHLIVTFRDVGGYIVSVNNDPAPIISGNCVGDNFAINDVYLIKKNSNRRCGGRSLGSTVCEGFRRKSTWGLCYRSTCIQKRFS